MITIVCIQMFESRCATHESDAIPSTLLQSIATNSRVL